MNTSAMPLPKTLTVPHWALLCIEIFSAWQMGVIYYSSKAFAVNGFELLPVSETIVTAAIVLGYLVGALAAYVFARRIVVLARAVACVSLICLLMIFLPLPASVLSALFYVTAFTCIAFIGCIACLIVNAYSLKTALADGLITTISCGVLVAILQNGYYDFSFTAFNGFAAVTQLVILLGLSRLPSILDTPFLPPAHHSGKKRISKPLLAGTLFVAASSCFCVLFLSTIAESEPHGIAFSYLTGALWGAIFVFFYKKCHIVPMRLYTIFLSVSALGFILWLLPISGLKWVSLVLQSSSYVTANLVWFMIGILFEKWRSRLLAPASILIALITVLLHAALLSAFRSNASLLYSIYAGLALVLLLVCFLIEPFLSHEWNGSEKSAVESNEAFTELTHRENDVAELLIQGYSASDISKALFISEQTVRTHTKNIYRKLDVHSRFELAALSNRRP